MQLAVALPVLLAVAVMAAQEPSDDKPAEKVKLPTDSADLARGKALFLGSCTYCHGPTGDGGKGADLARPELTRAKTDEDLVKIIEVGIPGTEMPGAWQMIRREVLQTAAFVRTLGKVELKPVPGSPASGKALYEKHGCATCHTIRSGQSYAGGLLGPDLSSIGLRRAPAYLRESLVDPGAALPENFTHIVITLKSGKTLRGTRLAEDAFTVTFRDLNFNNSVLARGDIKDVNRLRKESPMPSYRDKLSASQLDDLIAYLVSLKEQK